MIGNYIQTDELKAANRLVFLPFNEHSSVAVHAYLAKDPDFMNYALDEPEEIFPVDKESKTIKKTAIKFNGTIFVSYLPGEDIPHWSIEYANRHPHVEGITTTDFWLDRLYSDDWKTVRSAEFADKKDIDPREIIAELIEKGEYSFKINGYRVHWEVLEKDFPAEVAKFVVLGPMESSLEDYMKLHELEHISEKRLVNLGKCAIRLTFPEQKINTQIVTRSSEKWTRFRLNQNIPTVNTDLAQSLKSAKEAGLKIYKDFGVQPLIKSTVINGNGKQSQ